MRLKMSFSKCSNCCVVHTYSLNAWWNIKINFCYSFFVIVKFNDNNSNPDCELSVGDFWRFPCIFTRVNSYFFSEIIWFFIAFYFIVICSIFVLWMFVHTFAYSIQRVNFILMRRQISCRFETSIKFYWTFNNSIY